MEAGKVAFANISTVCGVSENVQIWFVQFHWKHWLRVSTKPNHTSICVFRGPHFCVNGPATSLELLYVWKGGWQSLQWCIFQCCWLPSSIVLMAMLKVTQTWEGALREYEATCKCFIDKGGSWFLWKKHCLNIHTYMENNAPDLSACYSCY